MDTEAPVYLLWVLDKRQADNINAEQTKRLKAIAKAIKDERNQGRKAPPSGGKGEA
jgi:hypothetical protein